MEDKNYLNLDISMENLNNFLSANFEVFDDNNAIEIFQSKYNYLIYSNKLG